MKTQKYTLILGASPNPKRYGNIAALRLYIAGKPFIPVGIKSGQIAGKKIEDLNALKKYDNIDTVTLYLSLINQFPYEDYILSIKPRRIIFNPGTENPSFMSRAQKEGIEVLEACTLVMLASNTYD
ncbi:MAG: CoA-binding protein [Flammeovirgaceae bacterium]|nr:CoA-binding protein [Flammeovirgaceae bacterium]|tara:strand:- start:2237 stop:2614 length:378 start_codon:yes stop_codon:yes gene_type:complete